MSITFAASVLLCAAAFTSPAAAQNTPAPVTVGGDCANERYKDLAGIDFSVMGNTEYTHFVDLDSKCRNYKRGLAAAVADSAGAYNACAHPPYVKLLPKRPGDMTKREWDYFRVVDRECAAHRGTGGTVQTQRATSGLRQFTTIAAVLGSIIITGVLSGRD